jgi:LmbE family N-acetylglucosaminyl deacetylase
MELIKPGTRILCLSPHPDDVEFGLGAILHKYKGMYEGKLIVFSDRSTTRGEAHNERDQRLSARILSFREDQVLFIDQLGLEISRMQIRFFGTEENRDRIRMIVSFVARDFEPTLIFTPGLNETMQDHQALSEEVVRIVSGQASIFGYEVPRSNRRFQPNVFVDVSEADLDAKIRVLKCFTEFTNRYYFESDNIRALARVRALNAGYSGYAEAFELYRMIVGP